MYKWGQNPSLIKPQLVFYYNHYPVHIPVLERLPVLKNTFHSLLWFQTSSLRQALTILTEVPPNLSEETDGYLKIKGTMSNCMKLNKIIGGRLSASSLINLCPPSYIIVSLRHVSFLSFSIVLDSLCFILGSFRCVWLRCILALLRHAAIGFDSSHFEFAS